ncbi:MAG: SRPBCC family protein [Verrucomicrobiales bacterium]|nr:SRPBCC family protein [Verrucomicrobiales bacterium]
MKFNLLRLSLITIMFGLTLPAAAMDFNSLPKGVQNQLKRGEIALLPSRPGESGVADKRFVTMAKLTTENRSEIWEVVIDKENTDKFLDNVLESRVIEQNGNVILMEQRTKVGGPKGSYQYTLKYHLTPETKAEFSFVKGDIKNVQGGWWILDGPTPAQKLLVYSLHIDPGGFAPQFIVQKGMKKSIPETILSTEAEVIRRRKAAR